MKKGFIILAIVVLIMLYVLNKVNTAKQLEFTIGLPRNVSVKGGALTFDLPLTAANISQGNIGVKSADFDIYGSGKFLGKAVMTEPTTIRPATQTVLLAKVTISFFDLLTAAGSIFNTFKSGKVSLTLDGLVYAEGFQFPVKQSFDFDTKQVL